MHLPFRPWRASDILTPLTRVASVYNGPKGMEVAPNHAIVEVAKALGGSFKLVTPAPKPVREMTQLPRETQKDGDNQTNESDTNKYTKYKPRLIIRLRDSM